MAVYFLILMCIVLFHSLTQFKNKKTLKNILIFLLVVLLIALQGLRSFEVGIDLSNYYIMFNALSIQGFSAYDSDPLFIVLNMSIINLGLDFRYILFVVSALTYIPLAIVLSKYSKTPFIGFFVFITIGFFVFSLSGLRQSIAIGMSLMAYIFVREKKPLLFLFFVVTAGLFHKSGFFTILLYPLYYFRFSKKLIPFILVLIAVTYIFRHIIFNSLVGLYYDNFVTYDTGAYGFLLGLLLVWLFSMYWFDFSKNENIVGHLNFLLLAIFIQLFANIHPFVMRLGYYFYVYLIFIFPDIISQFKRKDYKTAVTLVFFLFFSIYFLRGLPNSILEVYPYEFL